MQHKATSLQEDEARTTQILEDKVWQKSEKALVIVKAAQKVFVNHGYFAATTDMLQQEAGVSKSTLYQYYKSKEGMFLAVVAWTCENSIKNVQLGKIEANNVRDRLLDLGKKHYAILLNEEFLSLFRVVIEVSLFFPKACKNFYTTWKTEFGSVLKKILVDAAHKGEINLKESELTHAEELFYSLLRGEFFIQLLLFPQSLPGDEKVSAWIELSVDRFLAAYRPAP